MDSGRLFPETLTVLEKAMDLRSMRHNLIISNIANRDTPNYKPFDVVVEEEMAKSQNMNSASQMKQTDAAHFSGTETGRKGSGSIGLKEETGAVRGDGNGVDMDKEMARLSENTLLYNTLAQIISMKFQGMKDVIKGGG